MDPMTMALLVSAGSSLFGGLSQNRANSRNQKDANKRYNQLSGMVGDRLGQGPGGAETAFMDFLTGKSNGGAFNMGQDALMQMLTKPPTDTQDLFNAWEPMEARTLDNALSGAWSQGSGLGQRFGSAMMREEGKVRGQAAEQNTARRAETSVNLAESNTNRQQQVASLLAQLGLSGFGQLATMEQNRGNQDINLLQLLAGFGQPQQQANALPGAGQEISQLMLMLPLMQQLMGGGAKPAGGAPTGGGWTTSGPMLPNWTGG